MKVRADIHRTITKSVKGKKDTVKEQSRSLNIPDLQKLVGDGGANVTRSRSLKMSLPYGAASISASCSVSLSCHQDEKYINNTASICSALIEKLMETDKKEMAEFIEAMSEGNEDY